MFGFHQDRPQTGHGGLRVDLRGILPEILWKKAHWELCECEMEVASGGLVEDKLGASRGGLRGSGAHGPEDDIQLRRRCRGDEVRGFGEWLMEFEGGGLASF